MAEILRVSSTGDSIIYKENGRYYSLDTQTHMRSGGMESLNTFTSVGGWRRATKKDKTEFAPLVDSSITVISNPAPRTYRLPNSIKKSVSELNLDTVRSIITVDENEFLQSVSENTTGLTQDEVNKLYSIYEKVNKETAVLTSAGISWMKKIEMGMTPLVASNVSFDDDAVEYYATAPDPVYPTSVNALYKVEGDTVSQWQEDDFQAKDEITPDTFEAPSIVPIDNITAQVFATWLTAHKDDSQVGQSPSLFNLEEADPAENNLMRTEAAEIEAEFADDNGEAIIADGFFSPTKRKTGKTLGAKWWGKVMAKQYTSAERSANASKQKRNSSGQFAKQSNGLASSKKKARNKKKKASLASASKGKYKLAGKNNTKYRKDSIKTAGNNYGMSTGPTPESVKKMQESIGRWVEGKIKLRGPSKDIINTDPPKDQKDEENTDKTLTPPDRVEALPAKPGTPTTPKGDDPSRPDEPFERDENKDDADSITGEDDTRKLLMRRVEAYKKKNKGLTAAAEGEEESEAGESEETEVNTRYICIVSTEDYDAVTDIVALRKDTGELVAYVRLRAEWVDDPDMEEEIMGLTPPPMVELDDPEQIKEVIRQVDEFDSSAPESSEYPTEASVYTEYGEILPISAAADGIRGTERLKNYWTHGKGAAKIRWGTKGDLTRCHRHLAKYLGPQRAWGYCQNRHQDIFGVSNAKRDKG